MSSIKEQNENKYIVPKAPKPKFTIIPKNISYINLIEVDDDSESSQHEELSVSSKNSKKMVEKYKDDGYISDDRYEDSFDEEFGEGCETNPDSGNMKFNDN